MLNEVQKNIRMGKVVRFGLLVLVLAGLTLVVFGVRDLTKDLPIPEEEFGPRLTPPTTVRIQRSQEQAVAAPEKVYFYVDGKRVEGTVDGSGSSALTPSESAVGGVGGVSQGR